VNRWVAALAAAAAAFCMLAVSASATSPLRGRLVVLVRLDTGCGGPGVCTPQLTPFSGAHLKIRAVAKPMGLSVVSNQAGSVSVRLDGGLYVVVPQDENAKAPDPVRVRVRSGQTTRIRLVYERQKM
jgi:hypothetical protein